MSREPTTAPHPRERVFTVGELEVIVVDPQGLIDDVRAGIAVEWGGIETLVANPPDNQRELTLHWLSSPCETRPKIELRELFGMAELELDRDVRHIADCEDKAVQRIVTLELSIDLPASKIELREVGLGRT